MRTLWLQETVKIRGLQIKQVTSEANKADLGTKVLPEARLPPLRAACGIVAPGEAKPDSFDDNSVDELNNLDSLRWYDEPWVKWTLKQAGELVGNVVGGRATMNETVLIKSSGRHRGTQGH